MRKRLVVLLATAVASLSLAAGALAGGPQYIGASPGVYNSTNVHYTNGWQWYQDVGSGHYNWYVFTSGGTLKASGSDYAYSGSWSGAYNYYYWKFYNASSALMGFDVYWN